MSMTEVIKMCTENHHKIILLDVILGLRSQLRVLPRADIWAPPPRVYKILRELMSGAHSDLPSYGIQLWGDEP